MYCFHIFVQVIFLQGYFSISFARENMNEPPSKVQSAKEQKILLMPAGPKPA
jgi:hypothetical protein